MTTQGIPPKGELTGDDLEVWLEIVGQCAKNCYNTINVASERRRKVILKVDAILKEWK